MLARLAPLSSVPPLSGCEECAAMLASQRALWCRKSVPPYADFELSLLQRSGYVSKGVARYSLSAPQRKAAAPPDAASLSPAGGATRCGVAASSLSQQSILSQLRTSRYGLLQRSHPAPSLRPSNLHRRLIQCVIVRKLLNKNTIYLEIVRLMSNKKMIT